MTEKNGTHPDGRMIVELPSGAKVTMRIKLKADDKFTVQDAITLETDPETGRAIVSTGIVNQQRNALLALLIETWDVPGHSVPADDPGALADLDIDDYLKLCEEVEPMLQKVVSGGVPNPRRRS